jgi:uncharacterized protein
VTQHDTSDLEFRNKALVQDRFDAWKAGSGSPFDLLADQATWTIVGHSMVAKTYRGREAFMADVIRPFNARMRKGLKPTVRQICADGDQVAVLFDASAVRRDGKTYSNTYAWFLQMRDGRIVNATAFFDSIAFDELWRDVSLVT